MNSVAAQHAKADTYVKRCFTARPEMTPCCAAGCHACCSEPVYASQAEAEQTVQLQLTNSPPLESSLNHATFWAWLFA